MPGDPKHPTLDRRNFLLRSLAVGGALLIPGMAWWALKDEVDAWDPASLPPRVVGLRSLGGAFRFDPPGLLIEPGTELHWLNMGDFHTTTSFHPDNADLLAVDVPLRMPEGAEPWHSGLLGLTAGTQFSHQFTVEGVYDYFCQPHYSYGMVGRVVVGEAVEGPATTRPLTELIEAAREQMPSVDSIMGPRGTAYEWAARLNGILYTAANAGDYESAARATVQGMRGSAELQTLVGDDAWSALDRALTTLVDIAAGGDDYEALLRQADIVKRHMDEAPSDD